MKRSLIFIVLAVFAMASPAHAALTQFWKLDETSGTTATATTGTSGTYARNATNTTYTGSSPGTAITKGQDFNGTSDYADISGASLSFASGSAFSVSIWCRFDATTGPIIARSGDANGRIVKNSDTVIRVQGSTSKYFTVPSLGTTNWHHVLITRTTGNTLRCFLNGTESSTGSLSMAETFAPNTIGRQNTNYYDGKVAWCKVFDSDESANVAALYAEKDSSAKPAIYYYLNSSANPLKHLLPRFDPRAPLSTCIFLAP